MIDCCPFSVLVKLIAHEISGGWKDYRNSNAFKKAEVECVPSRFRGCLSCANLVEVAGKPFCKHHLYLCSWFYQGILGEIRY